MYTGRLSRAKVTSARSMKFTTCASWAPGVSVAGKICEDMASMSAACASVKNANGTGCAEVAARWAYASASRMAGQCVASQTEPSPATESARKSLRDLLLAMIAPFNQRCCAAASRTSMSGRSQTRRKKQLSDVASNGNIPTLHCQSNRGPVL